MWQWADQHIMVQVAWSAYSIGLGMLGSILKVLLNLQGCCISIADPRWYNGMYLVVVLHLRGGGKFGINQGGLQVLQCNPWICTTVLGTLQCMIDYLGHMTQEIHWTVGSVDWRFHGLSPIQCCNMQRQH